MAEFQGFGSAAYLEKFIFNFQVVTDIDVEVEINTIKRVYIQKGLLKRSEQRSTKNQIRLK